jgi:hypothetical protein
VLKVPNGTRGKLKLYLNPADTFGNKRPLPVLIARTASCTLVG